MRNKASKNSNPFPEQFPQQYQISTTTRKGRIRFRRHWEGMPRTSTREEKEWEEEEEEGLGSCSLIRTCNKKVRGIIIDQMNSNRNNLKC